MTNAPKPDNLKQSWDDLFRSKQARQPIRVSVSQIRKYKRCPRAWWYEYGPLQDKSPPKPSAALGTKVHDILEKYLLEGTEPPDTKPGRIASCGLDKLPDPSGLSIEESITLPLSENAKILCRIDMLGTDRFYIGDHKTTSDFKWAKTRGELNTDIQLLTYAYAAYYEDKPETVDAELIYYRTRGLPVSMSVSTSLSWDQIEKNWKNLGEIAEEMAPKKTDPTGETCTGNANACGDYGGCYHAEKCPFSPKNRNTLANNATTDNNESTATAEQTKGEKMDQKTQSIQAAFGLLPPDVAPEVDQTSNLTADTVAKLKNMADLFGGELPAAAVKNLLIRDGIEESDWPNVIESAGLSVGVDSITVTEPAKPAEPKPEFVAQRASFTDVDIRECANELREMIKTGRMDEQDVRNWYQSKMPPNKRVSPSRWNRLLMYSELRCKGGEVYIENPEDNAALLAGAANAAKKARLAGGRGFNKNNHFPDPGDPSDAPKLEVSLPKRPAPPIVPDVTEEQRIKNFAKAAPAIGDRLVLVVGAHFNTTPSHAIKFNVWIHPYCAELEKTHQKSWSALRLDFGKAEKYLEGVLEKAVSKEETTGLIIANRTDPLLPVALPILERAGALIIWGR